MHMLLGRFQGCFSQYDNQVTGYSHRFISLRRFWFPDSHPELKGNLV